MRGRSAPKRDTVTAIRIAMVALGKSRADACAETKSWYRGKSIDELRAILRELHDQASAAGLMTDRREIP